MGVPSEAFGREAVIPLSFPASGWERTVGQPPAGSGGESTRLELPVVRFTLFWSCGKMKQVR
jgi:hypothetical protein